ncbi:MAG TPA: 5-dehydro-4-deoxy-D-glucuronate isomerase [Devosia sp.]|jgi:4-deoxy-L-threo-5-hexosulose-uronate ketol-isomerase|nr:5-dehydro-4-deoxy-D-glucuronate isomerase [Devosia sp.]
MSIEVRQASHPEAVKAFDTEALRRHFLIERLFEADTIALTYSHIDRLVVGGAMPVAGPLDLPAPKPIGTDSFMARRELGVVNIGGPGRVHADGAVHDLASRDALYVAMGAGLVRFESVDAANPAKFYLLSAPAHARHKTVKITPEMANKRELGSPALSNARTIYQMIHPDVCASCQLVLGVTLLKPNNMWNTMPAHTHDRRSEAYLYFELNPDARVFHFMGEPAETRHLVIENEQAILSPGWSIHSGVGTSNYAFIWAMAGDNQDFDDMDMLAMEAIR